MPPLRQRLTAALGALFDSTNWQKRFDRPQERQTNAPIVQEVNPTDRAVMVSDSRKLYANLGPVRGAVDGKALYAIGRSWLPRFEGEDKAWGDAARDWLINEWYPLADISGNDFQTALFLLSVGVDVEGDSASLLTEYETGFPAIQLMSGLSIGNRSQRNDEPLKDGEYKGLRIVDGVVINDMGRAVAYHILGRTAADDKYVSARDMQLLKEPQFIGQPRGFPAFASSLLDLQDFRTVQGYEKAAAMLAASIGLVEWNETGLADMTDPRNGLAGGTAGLTETVTREMGGGTVKLYKAGTGAKLEAFHNARPGDAFERLRDHLIRSSMSGINWSFDLVWDISKLGGASARLEVAKCMRTVEDRQDLLKPFAKRAVGYAIAKAIKLGRLKANSDWWKWGFTMPARMTADYGRDKAQDREDYINGIINLSDICAENGMDIDQHIAQRKAENEKLVAAGLPVPMTSQQTQLEVAAAQAEAYGSKAKETEAQDSREEAKLAALETRHTQTIAALAAQPQPAFTINQAPINIHQPSVTVNPPEVHVAAPSVTVLPAVVEMSAPEVTVAASVIPAPVVNVVVQPALVEVQAATIPAPVVNVTNEVIVPKVAQSITVTRTASGLRGTINPTESPEETKP
jgi:hypothetical protein